MEPTKEITPQKFSNFLDFKELWYYRELLYFFAWRDYKVRYKETVIGALWALLQPLLTMIIFVTFFGRFKELTGNEVPYVLFVYSGLMLWHFFSNSILGASNSFIENHQIVTKVYFPRLILPLSAILVYFIDLFFAFIILFGLMIFFGHMPSLLFFIIFPFLIMLLAIASTGIGLFLGTLMVKYKDVKYITPFFVQLTLFLSPVIYSTKSLGVISPIVMANPITGIIDAFRSFLFGIPFDSLGLFISLIVSLIILILSLVYFKFNEEEFSDIL